LRIEVSARPAMPPGHESTWRPLKSQSRVVRVHSTANAEHICRSLAPAAALVLRLPQSLLDAIERKSLKPPKGE
jgi:hypothetical protein